MIPTKQLPQSQSSTISHPEPLIPSRVTHTLLAYHPSPLFLPKRRHLHLLRRRQTTTHLVQHKTTTTHLAHHHAHHRQKRNTPGSGIAAIPVHATEPEAATPHLAQNRTTTTMNGKHPTPRPTTALQTRDPPPATPQDQTSSSTTTPPSAPTTETPRPTTKMTNGTTHATGQDLPVPVAMETTKR